MAVVHVPGCWTVVTNVTSYLGKENAVKNNILCVMMQNHDIYVLVRIIRRCFCSVGDGYIRAAQVDRCTVTASVGGSVLP